MMAKRINKRFLIVTSLLFTGLCLTLQTLSAAPTKASKSAVIMAGKAVYDAQGCSECHQINGEGGEAGPDLSHVGGKKGKVWIRKQVTDSKSHFKNSFMPLYRNLSRKDMGALVTYLSSLK